MNKIYLPILFVCFLQFQHINIYAQPSPQIYQPWQAGFLTTMKGTHDMALPPWGPYSDKFNAISHVPSANDGFRFDVIVQPSLYLRNLTPLANVKRESGYHPWKAKADLTYFSHRYELEWKDQVFCDVSISKVDEKSRLIKAAFVNRTGNQRSLALNIFNTIVAPYPKSIRAVLPAHVKWQKAAGYSSFTDAVVSWDYNLVYNGQLRGQIADDNAVSHTAIVIGKNSGSQLNYRILNPRNLSKGFIVFRYRTVSGEETRVEAKINGGALQMINFPKAKDYTLLVVEVNHLTSAAEMTLKFMDRSVLCLDGFVLADKGEIGAITFEDRAINYLPKQIASGLTNAIVLKYDDIKEYYGVVWSDTKADVRELFDDNPDVALYHFNNLVKHGKGFEQTKINGNRKGWFKNVFSAPIVLKPNQRATRYAYVVAGVSEREVIDKLCEFNMDWQKAETIDQKQEASMDCSKHNKAGEKYRFSQQLMEATVLTNIIYPTFTANQFTKHTTPGKKWSSLYTWDSGFIGLGYSAINAGRALESLNAYTMDATEQSAFLQHGTPLPVQGYLFNELWNTTQNSAYLAYYYPRLKRYYDFLGGAESSTTRKLASNLIKTWDIFYNSGGWDDYSAQVFVHKEKLENVVAPSINTAHQIRFAKLLKMAAWQLGYQKDMVKYDEDIRMYSKALQEHAWDETSGYYGYVKHDHNGSATKEILRYSTGENLNMGLDGCSPLIAGICTPQQQGKVMQHLFTKGQLWTDYGITAIDQSAPYYSKDGYWNGRVWMPHQWFFWKTMLDLNEPERAIQIAVTALDIWKRETDDSYNCWENFSNETGNGGGWHQFGALSSPVLNWYTSLFKRGTITHGFDVWPIKQQFNRDSDGFKGLFKLFSDQPKKVTAILLCLNDEFGYIAKCNGKPIPLKPVLAGLYQVSIELGDAPFDVFSLEINKKL